jgi:hypothetical protein
MTLTRKLALALCLAFSFITLSSNAQVDSTTGNLINYGTTPTDTTSKWNNGVYVNQLGCFGGNSGTGYCGPYPNVQTNGNINFSYGQVDLNQIVNINKALSAGGTGVQLSGFNFGFMAKNGNGWDDGRQDYLSAYVKFYNAGGGLAANYDYTSRTNQRYNWTQFNFSETFASPIAASNYSNAQVGFVGRDNNYWAGPYGPEIYNVSFSLKYRVDPCATNPAYSSTCAGFSDVINSKNLFNSSQGGGSLNQAFAINTALGLAGSGATVHGINYGFNYTVGQGLYGCTAWNQDGSCSWYMNTPSYVSASMSLRNSDNQVIHQKNYSFTQEGTSGSVSEKYLLPSSMNQTLLDTARLTASSSGTGSSVSGAWANIIYTADPCATNPLYSTSCSGYGAAFAKNLASMTSTTSVAQTTLPLSNPPMDNSGPLVSDGSFGAISPMTGPSPGSPPPPTGMEPAPGSPPPAGNSPSTAIANASGPVQQQGGKSGGSAPNMSLVMSTISRVQAADKATQNAAVANAQQVVATSSAAAQAQANQVVDQANALSAESSQASQTLTSFSMQQGNRQQQTSSSSFIALQGPTVMSIQALTALSNQSQSITGDTSNIQRIDTVDNPIYSLSSNNIQRYTPGLSLSSTNNVAMVIPQIQLQQQTQQRFDTRIEQEQPQIFQPPQTALARGTILGDILEQRLSFGSFQMEQQMDTVKKNVLPNELAGGVDLAAMALMPKGYEAYSIVTLRDVPFYKSEAIYKDQRTIDNARVFRGLTGGSDAKHQEMVDQQYKLRN